jgi:hypothetical protein
MNHELTAKQLEVCKRFHAEPVPSLAGLKVGIALNVKEGIQPINGMRCPVVGDTTGWYIWAGEEWSDDPEFFVPLHVDHLTEWCPEVIPYLQLPPGWRFLIAPGHEDVWFDESLAKKEGVGLP